MMKILSYAAATTMAMVALQGCKSEDSPDAMYKAVNTAQKAVSKTDFKPADVDKTFKAFKKTSDKIKKIAKDKEPKGDELKKYKITDMRAELVTMNKVFCALDPTKAVANMKKYTDQITVVYAFYTAEVFTCPSSSNTQLKLKAAEKRVADAKTNLVAAFKKSGQESLSAAQQTAEIKRIRTLALESRTVLETDLLDASIALKDAEMKLNFVKKEATTDQKALKAAKKSSTEATSAWNALLKKDVIKAVLNDAQAQAIVVDLKKKVAADRSADEQAAIDAFQKWTQAQLDIKHLELILGLTTRRMSEPTTPKTPLALAQEAFNADASDAAIIAGDAKADQEYRFLILDEAARLAEHEEMKKLSDKAEKSQAYTTLLTAARKPYVDAHTDDVNTVEIVAAADKDLENTRFIKLSLEQMITQHAELQTLVAAAQDAAAQVIAKKEFYGAKINSQRVQVAKVAHAADMKNIGLSVPQVADEIFRFSKLSDADTLAQMDEIKALAEHAAKVAQYAEWIVAKKAEYKVAYTGAFADGVSVVAPLAKQLFAALPLAQMYADLTELTTAVGDKQDGEKTAAHKKHIEDKVLALAETRHAADIAADPPVITTAGLIVEENYRWANLVDNDAKLAYFNKIMEPAADVDAFYWELVAEEHDRFDGRHVAAAVDPVVLAVDAADERAWWFSLQTLAAKADFMTRFDNAKDADQKALFDVPRLNFCADRFVGERISTLSDAPGGDDVFNSSAQAIEAYRVSLLLQVDRNLEYTTVSEFVVGDQTVAEQTEAFYLPKDAAVRAKVVEAVIVFQTRIDGMTDAAGTPATDAVKDVATEDFSLLTISQRVAQAAVVKYANGASPFAGM